MNTNVSQPASLLDGNSAFNIEQERTMNKGYFKDFCQSFHWIYLKHKWFDDERK